MALSDETQREAQRTAPGRDAGPLLVVLSGPSGAGKDSILNALRQRGWPFHYTVTATTRPPRPNEEHGVDYYFLDEAEFRRMIVAGELIEHVLYDGTYRGVPRAPVARALAEGHDVLMRTDVRGARAIKRQAPGAVLIYILPPGLDVLGERMRSRDAHSAAEATRRLALAQEELATLRDFDYAVLNEEGLLDQAVDEVEAIVTAERCRIGRRRVQL